VDPSTTIKLFRWGRGTKHTPQTKAAKPLPLAGEGAEEGEAFRWGRGSKYNDQTFPVGAWKQAQRFSKSSPSPKGYAFLHSLPEGRERGFAVKHRRDYYCS